MSLKRSISSSVSGGDQMISSICFAMLVFITLLCSSAQAQIIRRGGVTEIFDESPAAKPPSLGNPEEEMRARNFIKLEEKRRKDTLAKALEGASIAVELSRQFSVETVALGREDLKKIERFEKAVKKVRNDLGGDGGDNSDDHEYGSFNSASYPTDVKSSLEVLADKAEEFRRDVEQTPRQVLSASVVNKANELLFFAKLIRQRFVENVAR